MPHTLSYRPILIDDLITNERLSSYQSVFRPANDVELMGVYLWNAHACGAIYPLIGAAEITLRNAIDRAVRQTLGNFWWGGSKLRYKTFTRNAPPPPAVQHVRENFAKATRKFQCEQHSRYGATRRIVPTHHGVVAKTEFSTWGFVLDNEFMGDGLIWPSRLGSVFAGAWPNSHASATLRYARDLVHTVRDFRNRLFHHEPAWKRFGIANEEEAISHLHEKISKIEMLLALIHPENQRLFDRNGLLRAARRACTSTEIRRFQHLAKTHRIGSIRELQALVESSGANEAVHRAQLSGGRQQRFLVVPA